MPACQSPKGATAAPTPSKDMEPTSEHALVHFIRSQFFTTIPLPTAEKYGARIKGRTALITGANTGLGYESARQLLSLGLGRLIMAVRSRDRGQAAADTLRAAHPQAVIDVWLVDMASNPSIRALAQQVADFVRVAGQSVDMVLLNAGVSPLSFQRAPENGHEMALQVNHLGTSLLAALLLPVLTSPANHTVDTPRLVSVNSRMAHLAKLENRAARPLLASLDADLASPKDWAPAERYGTSKLLAQLYFVQLAERIDRQRVVMLMVDPGFTKGTELAREVSGLLFSLAVRLYAGVAGRPLDRGAASYVDAVAGHGPEVHGSFLINFEVVTLSRWYYYKNKELVDVVWKETMQDPAFSDVEEMIRSVESLT